MSQPRSRRAQPIPDEIIPEPLLIPGHLTKTDSLVTHDELELEEEDTEPIVSPTKKTEFINLKYPIDVKKIIPRDTKTQDAFGSTTVKTYDVTCFSSIKYNMTQVGYQIKKDYPGYEWRIYAYRSVKKTNETVISKLKLEFNVDHKKKFVHVNVDLYH